jgi:hypothetical protein
MAVRSVNGASPLVTINFILPGPGEEADHPITVFWYHVPRVGDHVSIAGGIIWHLVRDVVWFEPGTVCNVYLAMPASATLPA